MKSLIPIFTLFLSVQTAFAYHPFWVLKDKKIIRDIVHLDKNNPQVVEKHFRSQLFQKRDTAKENLGFGWTMWTPRINGGYVSIYASFIYYNHNIVSYSIFPKMPDETGLIKRYKKWYQDGFSFKSDTIQPYHYNSDSIRRPLKEYTGSLSSEGIPKKLVDYMSPHSGTLYGPPGNIRKGLFVNRNAFNRIKDSLTNDQVILLMYSINPASRFTAIEYFFRHLDKFANPHIIYTWVEKNFIEIPQVETFYGCQRFFEPTEAIVRMYSTME